MRFLGGLNPSEITSPAGCQLSRIVSDGVFTAGKIWKQQRCWRHEATGARSQASSAAEDSLSKLSILRVLDALAEPRGTEREPPQSSWNHGSVPGEKLWDGRWKDTSKTQQNVTEIRRLAALKSDLPERRVHICFHQWRHTLLREKRSAKKTRNSPPLEVGEQFFKNLPTWCRQLFSYGKWCLIYPVALLYDWRGLGQPERTVGAASSNPIVRVEGNREVGRADGDIMCWERISLRV